MVFGNSEEEMNSVKVESNIDKQRLLPTSSYDTENLTSRRECTLRSILVLFGGILINVTLGSMYTFGNFSPYLISYLRERTSEKTLRNIDALWVMNISALTGGVCTSIGGVINKRFGARIACGLGCAIYCGSVALTYFSVKRSLLAVMFSYGLFADFGLMCGYGPTVQLAAMWFPRHPSAAIGMILCGFGGGAAIFNQFITLYINPHNKPPDLTTPDGEKYFTEPDLLDRVPNMFLMLAGVYAVCDLVGILLIGTPSPDRQPDINKPSPASSVHANDTGSNYSDSSKVTKKGETEELPVKQILKKMVTSKNFWVLWATVFLLNAGSHNNNNLYKAYGQTFISDDHFLALVGSISSVFNCICRPIGGYVLDKFGFQVTAKTITVGFVCLSSTVLLSEYIGKVFFLIWICGMFAFFSAFTILPPATLAKLFGLQSMIIDLGFMMLAVGTSGFVGGLAGIWLRDIIGWHGLYLFSGFLGAAAFLLTFFFDGRKEDGSEI